MRATWTTLHNGQYGKPEDPRDLSCAKAQDKVKGVEEESSGDYFEEQVNKLVDKIRSAKLGARLTEAPDVSAHALATPLGENAFNQPNSTRHWYLGESTCCADLPIEQGRCFLPLSRQSLTSYGFGRVLEVCCRNPYVVDVRLAAVPF